METNGIKKFLADSANGTLNHAKTLFFVIWNKGVMFALFFFLLHVWLKLSDKAKLMQKEGIEYDIPGSELLYALLIITGTLSIAPVIRFLIMPEASEYAERGWLNKDITTGTVEVTAALKHYWFATALCYLVTIVSLYAMTHR